LAGVLVEGAGARIGLVERALGRLLDRCVVRRLDAPGGAATIAVGGSTFGGSGKTPLAIACAEELARCGARTVLVGHAYRARPPGPRFVGVDDPLGEVGDEALLAARALAPLGARVAVAPTRAEAIAWAAAAADVLVLDGVAQLAPVPATLALLAVDADEPWGAGSALPLRGSLRANIPALLSACDAVVPMTNAGVSHGCVIDGVGRKMWPARVQSRGAWVDGGTLLTWEAIRSLRIGLLSALGRPERVRRWLERRGVLPRAFVRARDHGPFGRAARREIRVAQAHGIDVWLATPKCAIHAMRGLPGIPLAVLDHAVALDPALRNTLRAITGAAALTAEGGTNSLQLLESTRQVRSSAAPPVPSVWPLSASGKMTMMMRPRA
jgi:tetraacyldisaccharide 4'-kinase